jgi:site-specific recombinase XerD
LFSEKEEDGMAGSTGVVVVGPLGRFADAYRAELTACGYASRTVVNEVRQVARLSCWLEASGLHASDLSQARVEQFLTARGAAGQSASRSGLLCLLEVLWSVGAIESEPLVVGARSPAGELLLAFHGYLLHERGLVPSTAAAYVVYARRFLDGLSREDPLVGVTAREVTEAVLRETTIVSPRAAQYFVTALRSFLRYCFVEGLVERDLSPATLAVSGGQRSSLPKRISRSDARALLDSCDRRRAVGRRDYAAIITLLRLGLRASELAGLTLDDIDWRAAELVIRGKGGRCDRLPVPTGVS